MSEQEKSQKIFDMMGLFYRHEEETAATEAHYTFANKDGFFAVSGGVNLYNPANMALAWRVLNWASERLDFLDWWALYDAPTETAEVVLCASLDKIIELATEAGMIE